MPPFITASLNKCSGTSLLPVLLQREQKTERAVLFSEVTPEKAPFPFCAQTAKQRSKTAQWRRNQKVAAPFSLSKKSPKGGFFGLELSSQAQHSIKEDFKRRFPI